MLDIDVILQHLDLEHGISVADLGCGGCGHFLFPISAKVGNSGKVYGIDILKPNLSALRGKINTQRASNIELLHGDIEQYKTLYLEPQTIDRVLLVNTLFQMKSLGDVLRTIAYLLHPLGKLVVVDWDTNIKHQLSSAVASKHTQADLKMQAAKHGLKELQVFNPSKYHYGTIMGY